MSQESTEQNNEESKRNEEKDVEMEEEGYEDENNVITLYITKNVKKEWSDTKSVYQTS